MNADAPANPKDSNMYGKRRNISFDPDGVVPLTSINSAINIRPVGSGNGKWRMNLIREIRG
jgi:hypothetical protein